MGSKAWIWRSGGQARPLGPGASGRPAVLDGALCSRLQEYLRFRHLYRHGYGYVLEWPRLTPLLEGMEVLAPELRRQFDSFIQFAEGLADRVD